MDDFDIAVYNIAQQISNIKIEVDDLKESVYKLLKGHKTYAAPIIKSTWGPAKSFSHSTEDVECNNCGEWFNSHELCGRLGDANFCPNCGAAMTEEALRILAERNK